VADLDGVTTDAGNKWDAIVTITVVDGNLAPVANATVEAGWAIDTSGDNSCVTDANGQCSVTGRTNDNGANTSFTINQVIHSSFTYDAAANSDPDGDSDGTTITVSQPAAVPTPTNTPTPEPTPAASTLHVADLDGLSSKAGKNWDASVTITVLDTDQNSVTEATVSGSWTTGDGANCTTDSGGQCAVALTGINGKSTASVTFTVASISHAALTYDSAGNTDPDGDSDGTTITVNKP
jgi:protocatechuate 3,4-dioxygenase beta subunit